MLLVMGPVALPNDNRNADEPGDDTHRFTLSGDKDETVLVPLWKTMLDNNDADQNGHWLFERDGTIYAITEMYGTGYDNILRARRFDAASGDMLLTPDGEETIDFSLPDMIKRADWPQAIPKDDVVMSAVVVDDDDEPVLVTLRHRAHDGQSAGTGQIDVLLSTFDFENLSVDIRAEYPLYFNSTDIVYGRYATRYLGNIANVAGSLAAGSLSFEFAHGSTNDNKNQKLHTFFRFSQQSDNTAPGQTLAISDINDLSATVNGLKVNEHYRIVNRVDETRLIVATAPDELMLATISDDDPTTLCFVENLFSDETTHIAPAGNSGYCLEPVKHGDKTLWISACDYSPESGVRLSVMEWPDKSTFTSMQQVAAFPDTPFAFPTRYYARSARLIAQATRTATDSDGAATTPLTIYSPGSAIARYALKSNPANGSTSVRQICAGRSTSPYIVGRQQITIPDTVDSFRLSDMQGRLLISSRTTRGKETTVDTTHLSGGIYLLTVVEKGKPAKTAKLRL